VNDAFVVSILKGIDELADEGDSFRGTHRATGLGAFDQLEYERTLFHAIDRRDVGVVEAGEHPALRG